LTLALRRAEPALASIAVSLALLGTGLREISLRFRHPLRRRRLPCRPFLPYPKQWRTTLLPLVDEPGGNRRRNRTLARTAIETSHQNHRRSRGLWFSTPSSDGRANKWA
jgi:hypothetical protein